MIAMQPRGRDAGLAPNFHIVERARDSAEEDTLKTGL